MTPEVLIGYGLVVAAIVLFLLELKTPGLGAIGTVGALALIAGLLMVFGLSWATLPIILGAGLPLIALFAFLAVLAHRARQHKIVTGDAGMIGLEGRAETDLLPEGRVVVRGELWNAVSTLRIPRGHNVRVVGVRGLRLEVADASPEASLQPVSVVTADSDDIE